MMRKYTVILMLLALALLAGCREEPSPYVLCNVMVQAEYPDKYASFCREGVDVTMEEINLGTSYTLPTDAAGVASFSIPKGLYRVSISDLSGSDIFNGTSDKVRIVAADESVRVKLMHSRAGTIVIKEIYCGGCKRLPQEGTYVADQYIILHNNDFRVQYLDSLCYGTLMPYNSNATNQWVGRDPVTGESIYQDFLPVAQCIWMFGGTGTSFPLQPGEDAVMVVRGAIDHSKQYPLSVNLDRPGYFVCYNSTYFTNTTYHPAPGVNISQDRVLEVVIKTGQANAYTMSQNSPAVVLFRARGTTIHEFVQRADVIMQTPGDTHNPVVAIPLDWTVDAVEVFNGASSSNTKRIQPSLDAGYVSLSGTFLGHTLFRHTDEALSASAGYEVLKDTNNSSADMYERETQSLHE